MMGEDDTGPAGTGTCSEQPLLLVPGYTDAVTDTEDRLYQRWQALADNLASRGYDGPIEHVDLGPRGMTIGSPQVYADTVEDCANDLYREYGESVNVIGHSMGGLSTRWAVEQEDADTSVDTVVTLGTPHQGSPYAWFGVLTPGGRDMVPGSRFLRELNQELEPSVDYVAVYSTADEGYWPLSIDRASIPDNPAHDNVENIRVDGYTHMDLLTSDTVLDTYYESLVQ